MHEHGKVDRLKLFVLLAAIGIVAVVWVRSARSAAGGQNAASQGTAATTTPQAPAQGTTPSGTTPPQSKDAAPAANTTAVFEGTEGCVSCHGNTEPMHAYTFRSNRVVRLAKVDEQGRDGQGLSCTACHGGNPAAKTAEEAHVQSRFPEQWKVNGKPTSANPERTNTLLARESYEFVRFINPSDLRVVGKTCGTSGCHTEQVATLSNNMMRHGAMLWGAALYNNGGFPLKDTRFGESYDSETGAPERLIQNPPPTREQMRIKGIIAFLDPLPRWEISQPGNVLRVFERGADGVSKSDCPTAKRNPANPTRDSARAVWAPTTAPTRSTSGCKRRAS